MGQLAVNATFWTGELAFHLIQHHPFINNFIFRIIQFIVPAFLFKSFLGNIRIKNCIKINIHEVIKIFLIAAGNGIHSFIGKSHRIEKSLQTTFHKFYERFLDREIFRAAEYTVLKDVGYARVILRRGPESCAKHLIIIIVFKNQ